MGSDKVSHCVEAICNKGCQVVRSDIERLEQGQHVPEIDDLNADEVQLVLAELKDIMSVYGDCCPVDKK